MSPVLPLNKQTEQPLVVPASRIARRLSVTERYIHVLAAEGKIPSVRFGKRCIRFNEEAVMEALGIESTER